jgi:hypothetical protein
MQKKKFIDALMVKKDFDYVQIAIKAASDCVTIVFVGVNYVQILGL